MKQRIENIIQENLKPEFLSVKNNSHLHSGHMGDNGSGETHFEISLKSTELSKLSLIQSHRKINNLLKDEFSRGLHAIEIKIIK